MLSRWFFLLFALVTANFVFAAIDAHEFDSDVQRMRYQSFIDEMRCPKCQNQNLSGSDSPIATDLREELYRMIQDGRSDKEIVDFMVDRYGEYILYRPRLSPVTILLWVGPALLLLLGIVVLIIIVRQRRLEAVTLGPQALNATEQSRLTELLSKSPGDKTPSTQKESDS